MEGAALTAKEYLSDIKRLKTMIRQKEAQIGELRSSMTYLHGISYDRDRVQTSPQDRMPDQMSKLFELEEKYKRLIIRYQMEKDERIEVINSIPNPQHRELLILRYVDGKSLEEIAYRMHYSYKYAANLHGRALEEIEKARKMWKNVEN